MFEEEGGKEREAVDYGFLAIEDGFTFLSQGELDDYREQKILMMSGTW